VRHPLDRKAPGGLTMAGTPSRRVWDNVEGWLLCEEGQALHDCVARACALRNSVTVVEIGAWKGRSTIALASAIPEGNGGRVISIDPHVGSVESELLGTPNMSTLQPFLENITRAGVRDRVTLMQTSSLEARRAFSEHSVDLVFVDGSHAYQDVVHDLASWQTALHSGGVMAINDWSMPEVWRAVTECVLPLRSPFGKVSVVQNTLFATLSGRRLERPVSSVIKLSIRIRTRLFGLPATWQSSEREGKRFLRGVSDRSTLQAGRPRSDGAADASPNHDSNK
jgi:precorrin-6B methylase 2